MKEQQGATLRYTLKKPFNLFVDLGSYQEWLPILDTIRTDYMGDVLLLVRILPQSITHKASAHC